MSNWSFHSVVYHLYPLGLLEAPLDNDFISPPQSKLEKLIEWGAHARSLGANAIYLGPVFESSTHGYDTADYLIVDRRLGSNDELKRVVQAFHAQGHRVIFDGVFNHVGRDFWAFKDLREKREHSAYCSWFQGLKFDQSSPLGDSFTYETWHGYFNLVKLNLANPEVKAYLFEVAETWIREYEIDGFRLDAADCMDKHFLEELGQRCRRLKPDFWIFGEVVQGDYRDWAGPGKLDGTTNYEVYKGLYSSLNDRNYFEIAYALNRQFGGAGLYANLPLYNFADNHDVNRVASLLHHSGWLYPLYGLLFTMPGVPSIYYGSEWGIRGEKANGSDASLRPALVLDEIRAQAPEADLEKAIRRFIELRLGHQALQIGSYRQVHVSMKQLAFIRSSETEKILVLLNASDTVASIEIKIPEWNGKKADDLLNHGDVFTIGLGKTSIKIPSNWLRILKVE